MAVEIAPLYGLMAEFEDPHDLAVATARAREAGYRRMDAYTPYPTEEVAEALGLNGTKLPWLTFIGAILGLSIGFIFQNWVHIDNYPLNIGGRPLFSWPSWMPVTFEMTILFGSFTTVIMMLALNGLPQFYHPVFNVSRFIEHAGTDGFFLCIEAADPRFDETETRNFLRGLGAREVMDVPN